MSAPAVTLAAADPAGVYWPPIAEFSAPATQALAAIGLAVLAIHLIRRRRKDKVARWEAQDEAEWQRRLALWEERIGEHEANAEPARPQSDGDGAKQPGHRARD